MLPLIPALILLLLQGPASVERMARSGRLPQAVDAAARRLEAPQAVQARGRADAVLASLLRVGRDPSLCRALVRLLSAPETEDTPAETSVRLSFPPDPPPARLRDGFAHIGRSRDGPTYA